MTPIGEYLPLAAKAVPTKEALLSQNRRYSYAALSASADGCSAWLMKNGLVKGDRVIIYLENSAEAVVCIFGVLRAGGCIVVVNPTTPMERVQYLTENCTAKFIIAPSAKASAIESAAISWKLQPEIVAVGDPVEGFVSYNDMIETPAVSSYPTIEPEDIAAIIYTSGSTGKPKGVTLMHKNIDIVVETVIDYLENNKDDVILNVLQLSFGYGLLQLLATFRTGARLVLEKGVAYPYDLIKKFTQERVTGFAGAPTIWAIILSLKGLENEDFSSLRYITNAAAAMPMPFIPQLQKIFTTTKIFLMHGLTECLRTTYLPPEEINTRTQSVGTGMKNVELWLEDEEGNKVADGSPGELVIRGPNIMRGYWNDPVATSQRLRFSKVVNETVLYAGDLFRQDEEGYFYFVARMDDVIKSRGEKVSPVEVEDVIYLLEAVHECRVIGAPDPLLGQAVKAEIVLKPGATLTEREVKAYCQQHLEDYKVPKIVAFVESLPKTAGGKIKRASKD